MPGWLRVIAEHQPITTMVDTVRSPTQGPAAQAVLATRRACQDGQALWRRIQASEFGDPGIPLVGLITAPWPGPGNSEGPVDPDGLSIPVGERAPAPALPVGPDEVPFTTTPWPGPGDSEG